MLPRHLLAALLLLSAVLARGAEPGLFDRENLVAWCIVPFDKDQRTPAQRAEMLDKLGIHRLAWDWRAQHLPAFDREITELQARHIELTAVWFPTTLDNDARQILKVLKDRRIRTQLWVMGGGGPVKDEREQRARVEAECARIAPIADAAAEIGCSVALYNHDGWFGIPENQLAVIDRLKKPNVGIIYNLNHAHDELDRFAEVLGKIKPHLLAINLNGSIPAGDRIGMGVVPIGQGDLDLKIIGELRRSGWRGPVAIMNHSDADAELRLQDNLDGLAYVLARLDGKTPPLPTPRSWQAPAKSNIILNRRDNWLILNAAQIPGHELRINYLEAYCRGKSHDADWIKQTVIGHKTRLVSLSADRRRMELQCTLDDGVVVDHVITATDDAVDFRLTARNPTAAESAAQWAQACVRLGRFAGFDDTGKNIDDYLPKCFIFMDGKLNRMPTPPWATEARYTPGQVWPGPGVDPADVNPRPLSTLKPSNGLIGCFSADDKLIFATAWEPYQELFQGVARCLHSDFRIGGLKPGETKQIRGKIYIVPNDVENLLRRYNADFGR
ncbi:MAG: sugar phosphate isomerase/epimerase family protein [Tepidisphaerales bacterium]